MSHFKTRMASALLAFGVFFTLSCSTINNSNSSDRSPESTIQQNQERLTEINNELRDNPRNIELSLEKAELLIQISRQTDPPSAREPYYKTLRDIADSGVIDRSNRENMNEKISRAWSYEQGEAVKLLQNEDTDLRENSTEQIVSHFNNAITINPDSLVTYNLLANTHYRTGKFDRAIQTLEEALGIEQADQHDIREKLAYLYLESGKIENAIEHYRALAEENPDNSLLRHGLANAYMLNEQHDKSVQLLRELISDFPNRIEYKESLAGELYFIFKKDVEQITKTTGAVPQERVSELFSLLDEIDSIYIEIDETVPLSDEIAYRKAAYLNNTSRLLESLYSRADQNLTESLSDRRTDHLNRAMELWERLSENNPDNINYARNLYEIYVNLDMHEEAESLKRSYNL